MPSFGDLFAGTSMLEMMPSHLIVVVKEVDALRTHARACSLTESLISLRPLVLTVAHKHALKAQRYALDILHRSPASTEKI